MNKRQLDKPVIPGTLVGINPYDARATTVLMLGLAGLVCLPPLGTAAWIMGSRLGKEAATAGYTEPGRSKLGRICGIVATIIMVLVVVGLVLFRVNRGESHVSG